MSLLSKLLGIWAVGKSVSSTTPLFMRLLLGMAAITLFAVFAAVLMAFEQVGGASACLDMAVAYANERFAFGRPIGSFQAIKHRLADAFLAVERASALAYFATLTVAEDDPRRTVAVSMAKSAAGDCQRLLTRDGLQLHGGVGYTWEHDLHLFLRRAALYRAMYGTPEDHYRTVYTLSRKTEDSHA